MKSEYRMDKGSMLNLVAAFNAQNEATAVVREAQYALSLANYKLVDFLVANGMTDCLTVNIRAVKHVVDRHSI